MRLEQILRLRRERSGAVPMEVLRQLGLPMPEYVLEHFVHYHGTNGEMVRQYGHLDLHAIAWAEESRQARTLIECSIYHGFQDCVDVVARQAERVATEGWRQVTIQKEAAEYWESDRTWRVPPIHLAGEIVASSRALHLVEGHCRTGALTGLVRSGWLSADSLHRVWVGYATGAPQTDGPWRDVLRQECIPFRDWVIDHQGDGTALGRVASHLVTPNSKDLIPGDDLASVVEYAEGDPALCTELRTIERAHEEWKRVTSE